jgi:hypothetical protein
MSKERPLDDEKAGQWFKYMRDVVDGKAQPPKFNPESQELEAPPDTMPPKKFFPRTHADITHEEQAKKEEENDKRWEKNRGQHKITGQ